MKIPALLALLLPLSWSLADDARVRVSKIWDGAPHNAFTDLARFHDEWFCVFREAEAHVGGDGKIRVLASRDGEKWESVALIAEDGIDLRDPKICLMPDERLMLTMGGSVYHGTTTLQGRQPRVAFSKDGRGWSAPQRILGEGDWLWRVTWHGGEAYGVSYKTGTAEGAAKAGESTLTLYHSSDGVAWEAVAPLAVSGDPNETTLRFKPNGDCMVLVRRDAADKQGWFGEATPPYREWKWQPIGRAIGGPNFLAPPTGFIWIAGRDYREDGAKMAVGEFSDGAWKPTLTLPSGGDTGYPGMWWLRGELWLTYYSSHEGKAAIYLARILGGP